MKKIAVIVIFCFMSMISKPVIAEEIVEEDWDYFEVIEGSPAPISGLLFSYDGISNALVRVQQKTKLLELEKDQEREKLKLELQAEIKLTQSKLLALQEQHENQIKIKNEAINSLTTKLELSGVKTFGGIFLGLSIGVLVMGLIYGNK